MLSKNKQLVYQPLQSKEDKQLEALIRADFGKGVSCEVQHNVTWEHEDLSEHSPIHQAFEAFDKKKDKQRLMDVLRASGHPVYRVFANVLERCEVKPNPKHRPPALGHKPTAADAKLFVAINAAKAMVENGTRVRDAIAVAARELDLKVGTLADAYHGRRRKKK